eukprot:9408941-Karenia_brevis.AAC.1
MKMVNSQELANTYEIAEVPQTRLKDFNSQDFCMHEKIDFFDAITVDGKLHGYARDDESALLKDDGHASPVVFDLISA